MEQFIVKLQLCNKHSYEEVWVANDEDELKVQMRAFNQKHRKTIKAISYEEK